MRIALAAFTATVALAVCAPASAQTRDMAQCRALDASLVEIGEAALQDGAPGLVIAVARPGHAPVVRAFGQADVEQATPMQPDSVFRIASLTKQFTAALVLDLVEDGRLALEDRAVDHLPDRPWLGDITIYQLLVQTSGLPDYAEDPAFEANRAAPRSLDDMLDGVGRLAAQPLFSPGEGWAYSNSNYVVLGAVVERVTGQTFAQTLAQRVLMPGGLAATAVDDPRDVVAHRVRGYGAASRRPLILTNAEWIHPSMPGPAGALRSTAGDLLAWNAAIFSGEILEPETLALMTAPGRLGDGRTTKLGMPQAWQDGLNADYAMGLFVSSSALGPRLWHSGDIDGFVNWMAHYPESGVTIVILQNGDFLDVDHAAVERAVSHADGC